VGPRASVGLHDRRWCDPVAARRSSQPWLQSQASPRFTHRGSCATGASQGATEAATQGLASRPAADARCNSAMYSCDHRRQLEQLVRTKKPIRWLSPLIEEMVCGSEAGRPAKHGQQGGTPVSRQRIARARLRAAGIATSCRLFAAVQAGPAVHIRRSSPSSERSGAADEARSAPRHGLVSRRSVELEQKNDGPFAWTQSRDGRP